MGQLLRSLLVFFVTLIVLSYPIAWFISNHFYTYMKQNWILTRQNNNCDYAVLGSSRVFNMVDIKSLDSSWNSKGINLGTSGSCYGENFLILSEFVKRNRISKLLLNIDQFSLNSQHSFSYPFHDFEFLSMTNAYDSVFYDFTPTWKYYLWKVLPVTKYIEYNHNYTLKKNSDTALDLKMGTRLINKMIEKEGAKIESLKLVTRQDLKSSVDEKYLFKIINLCIKKNIKVILITTPIYSSKFKNHNNYIFEFIKLHPDLISLPYIKFEELIDYSNYNYFVNYTHTNSIGSVCYSNALGEKLKKLNL